MRIGKREYKMGARAAAIAVTRERILEAAVSCGDDMRYEDITLDAVAARADVSVQTILRHFDNRDNLFLATVLHMGAKMSGDRDVKASWGAKRIVSVLVDHYERFGDRVLWMLDQERHNPRVRVLTDLGRSYHAEWCAEAFPSALADLSVARRKRRLAQLVAATDIQVWKILRHDRELSPAQVKLAMVELVKPLLGPPR